MDTVITRLDAADFRDRLPEALGVYVDAMSYPPQVIRSRAAAWLEHSRRDGWSGVAAFETPRRRLLGPSRGPLIAIFYGVAPPANGGTSRSHGVSGGGTAHCRRTTWN